LSVTRVLEGNMMGETDVLQLIGLSRRSNEEYFVYTAPPFATAAERRREARVLNLFTDAMSPGLEALFAQVPPRTRPMCGGRRAASHAFSNKAAMPRTSLGCTGRGTGTGEGTMAGRKRETRMPRFPLNCIEGGIA